MDIKSVVRKVCGKCKTSDVFDLADALNIKVHYHDIAPLRGYYYCERRTKHIVIDSSLPLQIKKFVLAHEIGHSIMHPDCNAPFLRSTLLSTGRLEVQANKFAVELIIPDSELSCLFEHSIEELAMLYGLPAEIVELRLK